MSTALELVAGLRDALTAGGYPATIANTSARHGVTTATVVPERVEYEDIICDPQPILLTVNVIVQAAAGGEQGVFDLLGHVDPVAAIIRSASFAVVEWNPIDVDDQPAVEFTATANGTG